MKMSLINIKTKVLKSVLTIVVLAVGQSTWAQGLLGWGNGFAQVSGIGQSDDNLLA